MALEPGWRLVDFEKHLDLWAGLDKPDQDRRLIVGMWIFSRADDPFEGAQREKGFENLWYARIRETWRPDGTMVTCSYIVDAVDRVVYCKGLANLPA